MLLVLNLRTQTRCVLYYLKLHKQHRHLYNLLLEDLYPAIVDPHVAFFCSEPQYVIPVQILLSKYII